MLVGSHEPVVVKRGQSALFRADEPNRYRNDGKTMARFVLAVHEPSGVCALSARWLSFAALAAERLAELVPNSLLRTIDISTR